MLKCLHTGVFTKIMCQCDQPELNVNFVQAFYNSINLDGGRDTLQGACAPPHEGRGRGPLDTSSRDSGDEGDNGRGRNGAKRSGVPLEGIPSSDICDVTGPHEWTPSSTRKQTKRLT